MAIDLGQSLLLLVVAGAGIGVAVAAWMLAGLGTALAGRSAGKLDDKLARALRLPLAVFAGLVAASVALLLLLQARIDAGLVVQARRLLSVLFLLLAAWGILRVVRAVLERTGERKARFQPAARVGSRLAAVLVYTVAFLMVLSVYGLSITPVLTGLGIAGLAVALALQDTGANFFAGIWIQTGKSLQPGHYVKLEQEKLEGYIEEVGWRVTRIRTLGGNTIVVPNNKLAQSITTDYNLPDKTMAIGIRFRAGFEADPDLVMRVLVEEAKEAMKEHDGIVPGEPFAQLAEIADDANVYEVSFRVTEFVQQYRAQQIMRLRVLRRFHLEKIRIPYPTKHNLQEPVEAPKAKRKAEGPGGLAPGRRPPRPKARAPPLDPMVQEAERAKKEIAEQQAEKRRAEADGAPASGASGEPEAKPAMAGPVAPAAAASAAPASPPTASGEGAATAGDPDAKPAAERGGAGAGDDGGEKPANPLTRT